jgi:hypothetical protein
MDDVVCMAVGNGGEHLLHDVSSISLTEVRSLCDLVEQLSPGNHLSDNVVPFLILICLEQFYHVWVVHCTQDHDLLAQSLLFIRFNCVFDDNLDCSLSLLSGMNTLSDLTKGTRSKDISNFVV